MQRFELEDTNFRVNELLPETKSERVLEIVMVVLLILFLVLTIIIIKANLPEITSVTGQLPAN